MQEKKRILALLGSTRKLSSNLSYIKAIATMYEDQVLVDLFSDIAELPHFNPDIEAANTPKMVLNFRARLAAAEGILICTPEYAMGVPGSLKNAIDWTVATMDFAHKPLALITASSIGQKGHASLLETLKVIESDVSEETQLIISFAKTKIKGDMISDTPTELAVSKLMDALLQGIEAKRQRPLTIRPLL